jgi:hypothetical protein
LEREVGVVVFLFFRQNGSDARTLTDGLESLYAGVMRVPLQMDWRVYMLAYCGKGKYKGISSSTEKLADEQVRRRQRPNEGWHHHAHHVGLGELLLLVLLGRALLQQCEVGERPAGALPASRFFHQLGGCSVYDKYQEVRTKRGVLQ